MTRWHAAALAGLMGFGIAGAQSVPTSLASMHLKTPAFQGTSRQTWNTVMIISAGVAVLGLLNDDSTLTIVGLGGVALSLFEMQQMRFQLRSHHGFDLAKSGPLSFGYNPWGRQSFDHGVTGIRPGPYVQLTFRF